MSVVGSISVSIWDSMLAKAGGVLRLVVVGFECDRDDEVVTVVAGGTTDEVNMVNGELVYGMSMLEMLEKGELVVDEE